MPEGDSLFQAADLLRPLVGRQAVRLTGSARAVREWRGRVAGRKIDEIHSRGKHLLIHFEGNLSVRTHLGMTGQWHRYGSGERWSKSPGKARVVVETANHVAVCFAAPDVSVGPREAVEEEIAHLGPDLLSDGFDPALAVERMEASEATTAADLLLDQRIMAGVGNVYKSEVLFMERVHPLTPPAELSRDELTGLAARARRLLWANRSRGARNTTGYGRNANLWVYDRARRPCRRCGTAIEVTNLGEHTRSTYWCPRCQPFDRVDA